MTFDREKGLAKAQKLLQKGKVQEAIEEYEKILEVDPKDVRILQKVGDLQAKAGNIEAATEYFRKVAEFYAADGFFLKAVAVYKQISKLDPGIIKIYLRLAELYNQLGLNSEAMKQYQIVMKHYEKKGMKKEYLEVVKKLADLDPDNVANRLRLADLYAKEGQKSQAVEEYKQIAQEQKEKGNIEDLTKIYEAILGLEPADISLNRELAAAYLKIGEPKKALTKLQICFKAEAKNTETLGLLAKAFWDLQQPEKAKSVYQELIAIYEEQGKEEEKGRIQQKMKELFSLAEEEQAEAAAMMGGDELIDVGGDLGDLEGVGEAAPGFSQTHAEAVEEVEVSAPQPAKEEISGKLLAEVEVYLKYGLTEKAADNVLEILRLEPANAKAVEALLTVAQQVTDRIPLIKRLEHLLGTEELQAEDLTPLRQALTRLTSSEPEAEVPVPGLPTPAATPIAETSEEGEDEKSAIFQRPAESSAAEAADEIEISLDVQLPESDGAIVLSGAKAPTPEAAPAAAAKKEAEIVQAVEESAISKLELKEEAGQEAVEKAAPAEAESKIELDLAPSPEEEPSPAVSAAASEFVLSLDLEEEEKKASPSPKAKAAAPKAPPPTLEPKISTEVGEEEVAVPALKLKAASAKASPAVQEKGKADEKKPAPSAEVKGAAQSPPILEAPPKAAPKTSPKATPARAARVIDLEEELREKFKNDMEEAEFFISQELFDEALHIYRGILEKDATYEPAKVKLQGLEKKVSPAKAKPVATKPKPEKPASTIPLETRKASPALKAKAPASPPDEEKPFLRDSEEGEGFFDLAEALRDEIEELDQEPAAPPEQEGPSLEEVISQFKQGVQKTLKETDYQAHYDLGIAYKEMGLFDDAIAEFSLASRDSARQRECSSNIGLCYSSKGDHPRAIQIFEKMLADSHLGTEERLGIKYELAGAYQAKGDQQRALTMYQEIADDHPSFREVQSRIKSLTHPKEKGKTEEGDKKAAGQGKNKITYI